MFVCGVDDAGRGSIIGPLVIAGVLVNQNEIHELVNLGVKDSKLLSPIKRIKLATEIVKLVKDHYIVKLSPSEIDVVVENGSKLHRLNRLEAHAMAEVITNLKPDVAYVDASDVLPERYAEHIAEKVPFKVKIISEHKADRTYPVVSAASIIAKVERDKAIAELNKIFGNIGSGYCSDPKTISFLKNWVKTYGFYPEHVRRSWITAKKIIDANNPFQGSLV
ncbi:MAG: ribonuclease HII [Candidatus Bathyarchaeia archaeon]|nr:ribonuclease HII [Candidatus Bathyarchaeota archaeon]